MFFNGKERRSLFLMAMAAAMAAGCGGGQSGASSANATLHTSQAGEAVLSYFGQPKPQLTSSSGTVTVLGQAGATFSTVTLEPPPKLDNTYLVVGRAIGVQEGIYTLSYPAGAYQLLFQDSLQVLTPAASAYGTVAFYDASVSNLRSIRVDGTGLTSLVFGSVSEALWPHYSIDGTNRLTFEVGADIYVGPGTGGTPTLVQSNSTGFGEAWNPAGTKIIYSALVGTGDNSDLFTTPVGGGAPTDVTPTELKNAGAFGLPAWSPDGVSIAAQYAPSGGGNYEIVRFNVNNPDSYAIATPSGDNEVNPAFSPDGSKLAVVRSSANSQASGIYVEDATGLNETVLAADPSNDVNGSQDGISWSPFLPKETVIASSASTFYHQAASGFLLSQNGDQFGSLVAFTATTPADAAIQSPTTAAGDAPLAFTLTADSITSIGYINNYFGTGTTITLTSTPSVVVTIGAITGQVVLVAPAATAKATPTKNAAGTWTYKASFTAVYDEKGKNLAPNGTSSLTVDPKSGKLVRLG